VGKRKRGKKGGWREDSEVLEDCTRSGKEEVEKKTGSARQSERQWVAPYRGIETEYVRQRH